MEHLAEGRVFSLPYRSFCLPCRRWIHSCAVTRIDPPSVGFFYFFCFLFLFCHSLLVSGEAEAQWPRLAGSTHEVNFVPRLGMETNVRLAPDLMSRSHQLLLLRGGIGILCRFHPPRLLHFKRFPMVWSGRFFEAVWVFGNYIH